MLPESSDFRVRPWSIGVSTWLLTVSIGLASLYQYSNTPGRTGSAPDQWPAELSWNRPKQMPRLLLFVHPHCPCSHASLEQLERLMAMLDGRFAATVVFPHPQDTAPTWHQTDLWRRASSLDHVQTVDDVGGRITRRFGVLTSGQVLLYDELNRLTFQGGITAARGHAGDNSGADTIMALIGGERLADHSRVRDGCVFGCPLYPEREPQSASDTRIERAE